MVEIEVDAMPDADRKARVRALDEDAEVFSALTQDIFERAGTLQGFGLKPADAVHVAAAEHGSADVFLSCDDQLCKMARRHRDKLIVEVTNPLSWLKEQTDGSNT
jgi:predicted nucleic acid-binding protein